jgi:Papain family cysteine protease
MTIVFLANGFPALGWRFDIEDHDKLVAEQTFFDHALFRAAAPPPVLDPTPFLEVKNQHQLSGCAGWSGATNGEHLQWIKTGGSTIRFSEMHHYITAQKRSNTFGTDDGATIDGSRQAMEQDGFALQQDFPDTGKYVTTIPDQATKDGLLHLARKHAVLESYDAGFQWLATGTGTIQIGIPVGDGFMRCTGVLTRDNMRGKPEGGHALAIVGYSARKDEQGRQYLILKNSWGPTWGVNGCCEVEPALFDIFCKSQQCEVIGITDLDAYEDAAGRLDFTGVFI